MRMFKVSHFLANMSVNYCHFHVDYFSVSASDAGTRKCKI